MKENLQSNLIAIGMMAVGIKTLVDNGYEEDSIDMLKRQSELIDETSEKYPKELSKLFKQESERLKNEAL